MKNLLTPLQFELPVVDHVLELEFLLHLLASDRCDKLNLFVVECDGLAARKHEEELRAFHLPASIIPFQLGSVAPFDVDCLDAAFVPGTGWPEPGGFLPREVLKFIQLISERPLAGMEVVECSPPYDTAEITALIATRVICDTLGCQVRAGHLPRRGA